MVAARSIDTIHGFAQLVIQFPKDIRFVVWLNHYWGRIENEGKSFEHMKVYRETKNQISALIQLPELKKETYGYDLADMLQQKLTFKEILERPEKNIMTRQRLKIVRDRLFDQLDNAGVL